MLYKEGESHITQFFIQQRRELKVTLKAVSTDTLQLDARDIVVDTIHRIKHDNYAVIVHHNLFF